jgi:hypothetical protein
MDDERYDFDQEWDDEAHAILDQLLHIKHLLPFSFPDLSKSMASASFLE